MSSPDPPNVWKNIYDDVKIQIPGVTDAVFKQMLYQVWGDFCDRTNIWIEEVPIPAMPNVVLYPFTLANKGMPNRLLLLYDPQTSPARHWVQGSVEMNRPGTIRIMYAPSTAVTWMAVVAKTPHERTAEGYPDINPADEWIIEKYGDGMHYGVLGRLMEMPAKPYTNTKLGSMNWQYYVTERGKARSDATKSNIYGGQRWMFPQSFAVGSRKGWT